MAQLQEYKPQRSNANKHTPRGLGALERSIQQDGWIGAITVAADGETFDGSARLETGVSKGFDDAIVIESDGTRPIVHIRTDIPTATDPRAKRLGVAANRVASLDLEWDTDVLSELNDEGLLDSLFLPDELEALLAVPVVAGDGGDDFDTTPQEGDTRVKRGEIFACGKHRVGCLDSTDPLAVDTLLAGVIPDMVWADPPYGISIVQDNKIGASNLAQVGTYAPVIGDETTQTAMDAAALALSIAPKAVHIWWGANNYAEVLPASSGWIVWDKRDGMESNNFADCELAWTNQPTAARMFSHRWSGMLKASEHGSKRVHPTQKPIALAEWAFEKYGKKGDIVLDQFLGSGMSIIAAERTDRVVYGSDLSPQYCDVCIKRWEAETGEVAVRVWPELG